MRHARCRGQNTMEYILILVVILIAVIAGATNLIKPAVTKTLTESKTTIENAATNLSNKVK